MDLVGKPTLAPENRRLHHTGYILYIGCVYRAFEVKGLIGSLGFRVMVCGVYRFGCIVQSVNPPRSGDVKPAQLPPWQVVRLSHGSVSRGSS